ncbi:MAG: acyl carrier protein [Clostridiales bacterium]|nr:acyl carrier protein [Clostridiales bacterium]
MDDFTALYEILEDTLGLDRNEIQEEKKLREDLGADSVDMFQIFVAMEEEYKIELDTDETEHVSTIGDLMQIIRDYV